MPLLPPPLGLGIPERGLSHGAGPVWERWRLGDGRGEGEGLLLRLLTQEPTKAAQVQATGDWNSTTGSVCVRWCEKWKKGMAQGVKGKFNALQRGEHRT